MIRVENLNKSFYVSHKEPGFWGSFRSLFIRPTIEKKALHNVSFNIAQGEIVGLIGANGAGKTTLSKILSGIVHPTSGEISVLGHTPWERDNDYRRQMALIMGQKASLWWDLPALDCYLLLKEIYEIPENEFQERLDYLSTMLEAKDYLKVQIRRLSLGERMKVELIATLLHNPKVVFLDEPTIGLDLTAQKAIRHFLLDYRKRYQPAMILTSHYMQDIEELCERIIVLKSGEIVYDGALKKITQRFGQLKVISAHLDAENSDQLSCPNTLGEVIECQKSLIKIKTRQNKVTQVVEYLLKNYQVIDFTIEEIDISETIEQIIRVGMADQE